jgi:hypothetical protein
MTLRARIAGAEARLRILSPGLRIISIRGGLDRDAHEKYATHGECGEIIERQADEDAASFQRRARQLADAAGSRVLIFGGLPPMRTGGHA